MDRDPSTRGTDVIAAASSGIIDPGGRFSAISTWTRAWEILQRRVLAVWTAPRGKFLAAMCALALVLRLPRLGIRYWGDEAISIGIASHRLSQIPHYLRYDGSPPLYYVLLRGWMSAFGSSPVATHSLSLVISLVAIPVSWWCAKTVFGRGAARPAALLSAVMPYMVYYGTETRMYVLVAVISMLAVTGWVRAMQAPRGEGGRWLALAAGSSVAVLYTHNWGLFLVAALSGGGVAVAVWRHDRIAFRRSVLYAAVTGLAYLPWLPSFWWQLHYTGAPWAPRPSLVDFFVDPVHMAFSWAAPFVVAGVAVAALALRPGGSPGERGAAPPPTPQRQSRLSGLGPGVFVIALTVLLGWVAAQFVHSWAPRYLGVAFGPAIVFMAGTFAATRRGRRLLPGVVAFMVITALPVLVDPPASAMSKSNVAAVDQAVSSEMAPGDLVITTALAQLPVISYYMPKDLVYATPMGVVHDPRIVDWDNLSVRLASADPTTALAALLRNVAVGGHVLLVDPLRWQSAATPRHFQGIVAAEGIAVSVDVLQDPAYSVVRTVRPHHPGSIANPVVGILLQKTG